ncbi:unnamed protein product (mitochondrion) [Plasmodiophora brassicae]|uniref:Coiled-coil domain-containing protein 61 n=1 Tax=Plasmodiophora brassicae TaxID=37360 RepID=A0A3P3YEW1_PLABS|nr:unnamed protein product [Plasmodiophora brassicae]
MSSRVEQHADLTSHSVDYALYSAIVDDELIVEAEQKSNGQRWSGVFTAKYIEDMTANTGNVKKFSVFVNMLWAALRGSTDSVFVDLLTASDLESLRSRTAGPQSNGRPGTQRKPSKPNNKRYLILTYTVEFDRVHYPLMLKHSEVPETEALQRTIQRLRAELATAKSSRHQPDRQQSDLLDKLQAENRRLAQMVDDSVSTAEQRLADAQAEIGDLHAALSSERAKVQALTKQLEKLRLESMQKPVRKPATSSLPRYTEAVAVRHRFRLFDTEETACFKGTTCSSKPRIDGQGAGSNVADDAGPAPFAITRDDWRSRSPRVPAPRFDPTAYVRERAHKLRSGSSRSPSPWTSQAANSSPARSRGRSSSRGFTAGERSPAARSPGSGKENSARQAQTRTQPVLRSASERLMPKRTLDERKALPPRIDDDDRSPSPDGANSRTSTCDRVRTAGQIRDLDARLNELQRFLKVAKSSSARALNH